MTNLRLLVFVPTGRQKAIEGELQRIVAALMDMDCCPYIPKEIPGRPWLGRAGAFGVHCEWLRCADAVLHPPSGMEGEDCKYFLERARWLVVPIFYDLRSLRHWIKLEAGRDVQQVRSAEEAQDKRPGSLVGERTPAGVLRHVNRTLNDCARQLAELRRGRQGPGDETLPWDDDDRFRLPAF